MKTRDKVKLLTEQGWTPREIHDELKVSTQAVYQHRHKLGMSPAKATP